MTPTVRPARLDPRSPLVLDAHELGRRPGSMRAVERTVPAPADLGSAVLGVPEGSPLRLALRLEAVVEGVLVTGDVDARAAGECVRCLDPASADVQAHVQELFRYPGAGDDPRDDEPAEGDEGDLPELDGDLLDLEPVVRDALVLALPFQPTCREDCPGLCARCGARLADDPEHGHDETDPRWAALAGLATRLEGDAAPGEATEPDPAGGAGPQPTTETTDARRAPEEPN